MITSRRSFLHLLSAAAAIDCSPRHGLLPAITTPAAQDASRSPSSILLDRNENPYGPFPSVLGSLQASLGSSNRHPRTYQSLVESIARYHNVRPEQVLLGCGSSEILRMAAFAFLGKGKRLVQASPTFDGVSRYARAIGGEVVSIPLTHDWSHDLARMRDRIDRTGTLVYVCNPNNPTATITPRQQLEEFVQELPSESIVIIDEAYHHYARESGMYASFIDRPVGRDNVIVTRTFTTVYGLAGLRLGYAITSPAVVERMNTFRTEEGVNVLATRAGEAALGDKSGLIDAVARNADDRQEFFNQAMVRAMKPIDSHGNFVLMNTFYPAEDVIAHFREKGIVLGPKFEPLDTYIRVSLGRPEEMKAFWRVWDALPYPKRTMQH